MDRSSTNAEERLEGGPDKSNEGIDRTALNEL
jgi:hypothetical protein